MELEDVDMEFGHLNKEIYRRFLREEQIANYGSYLIEKKNENSKRNKVIRLIVLRLLLEIYNKDHLVIYFDESVINHFSFKSRVWKLFRTKQKVKAKTSFKSIRFLACITHDQLLSVQFSCHSDSNFVYEFLRKTLSWTLKNSENKQIILFLDNSTSNKTDLVRSLVDSYPVKILYNASSTPNLNATEQYFEFVKRRIRNDFFKSDYKTIVEIIHQSRAFSLNNIQNGFRKEAKNLIKIIREDDF